MYDRMRTCEGWYCLRGAVWEAEEGIYYWCRYPWPVGREDLLVLYSHRLSKDNNNNDNTKPDKGPEQSSDANTK